jgi:hypothetical protein
MVMPAPLTGRSSRARVHRSRLLSIKLVVDSGPADSRRGLLARLRAALRQLELAGHVAGRPGGRVHAANASVNMFYASALGGGINSAHGHGLQSCCPMVMCLCACIVAHEEHVVHVRE